MANPLISVIITVYNTKPYLEKCFESVFSQNREDIEIIIVNDGSTDGSLSICRRYLQKYSNVILMNKQNGGASDARNAGLREATGEYIHFIDSDDYLIYQNLYRDLVSIISNHRPDIIFCLNKEFTTGDYKEYGKMPRYHTEGLFEGNVLLDVLKNQYVMTLTCPVNKMFKRSILIDNNLFFVSGLDHEEDEWLPRVISCAKTAYYFNKFIYGVRVGRSDSLSNSFSEKILARKGRSKMIIADTGMEFMKAKGVDSITLRYIAGHYWEYMIGAVINTVALSCDALKQENYSFIRSRKRFFTNYPLLLNRRWRIMGWMFAHLGVKFTSKIVGARYLQ